MAWIFMTGAIVFEVSGTVCLKLADGFSRLTPSLAVFPLYGISLALLALALRTIPVSTAYAIWSAVGTALVAAIGIVAFREPAGVLKLVSLGLVIVGVVGLHLGDRMSAPL